MKISVIIQARMNSQRLPGKVLRQLKGRPLLDYIIERLERSDKIDKIIVATSTDISDQAIVQYCLNRRIPYFRGSRENVAERFKGAIERYKLKAFVRICADSPLLDCHFLEEGIKTFASGQFEIVTNILKRTFPKGQSFEIFTARIFLENYKKINTKEDCEHVTSFFYTHAHQFRIFNIECPHKDYQNFNLSVDTLQDFHKINRIMEELENCTLNTSLEQIVEVHQRIDPKEIMKA